MLLPHPLPLLPSLRLSAPALSGRIEAAVTLSTVARLVASGTAMSKADLVPAAGLARTTVSTAVDELLARGVLRLDGTRPTAGRGRPADRLALSPRGGHVLLADIGASGAHLAVVDLSQRVLGHTHVDVDVTDGPEVVLRTVESHLTGLLGQAPDDVPVRAVVIGLPGPVDGQLGVPVRPPIMPGWHAYPVTARLQQTYRCPAVLENDVNLRALGEARALPADQVPLLFVKVGTGIGGGLITREGVLHHGADGAAGDIGHVRVRGAPDDACVCGNVGCIEAVASAGAIARRLAVAHGSTGRGGAGDVSIADVRALVGRGDPVALGLVREAAGLIGELVATLVHFYNPARVTIGGSLTAASDELLAGVRSVVYQRALPLATRNLVLTNSVLGEYGGLAGAAVLGIERVLSADSIGVLTAGRS
ncbi:ROK family protein [Pseudonocardia sp.]|jgi:predicted NBD/HSP70 family sugar kinase|uniref:ROK family protein n=1 Tax=Pseudonocardia sp. TaxID=60912 RepID=UPI002D8D21A9|nr:ROK family protein [Pseudonocardia sp.]